MFDSPYFSYVILPILIFLARIIDVSIGTLRIAYLARGKKILSPILVFFEVLIWIMAIGQIFRHLDNFLCYIAYAGGFAAGNYIGLLIEEKLALGTQIIRIITKKDATDLIAELQSKGYSLTTVDGEGKFGSVKIIFLVGMRKEMGKIKAIIHKHNPNAFFTIEDVNSARELNHVANTPLKHKFLRLFRMDRKRK